MSLAAAYHTIKLSQFSRKMRQALREHIHSIKAGRMKPTLVRNGVKRWVYAVGVAPVVQR